MLINSVELESSTVITDYNIGNVTEAERLALSPTGGEQVYQTDGAIGVYNYIDGSWKLVTNPNNVSLSGGAPSYVESTVYTFQISNFNSISVYSGTSSLGGTVSIDEDGEVTYTTPASAGAETLGITQDGRTTDFSLTVGLGPLDQFMTTWSETSPKLPRLTGVVLMNEEYYAVGSNAPNSMMLKFAVNGTIAFEKEFAQIGLTDIATDGTSLYAIGTTGATNHGAIVKVDSSGDIVWIKTLGLGSGIRTRFLGIHIDGSDIYVVGHTDRSGSNLQAITVKYDTNGNVIWQRELGISTGTDINLFRDITIIGTDLYAVGDAYAFSPRSVITKLNASGEHQWSRLLRDFSTDYVPQWESVVTDGTSLYVAGTSTDGTDSGCVAKYDTDGNLLAQKNMTFPVNATFDAIGIANGSLYICGSGQGVTSGNQDQILIKLDDDLELQYTRSLNNTNGGTSDRWYDMQILDIGFVLVGSTHDLTTNLLATILINSDDGDSMTGTLPTLTQMTFSTADYSSYITSVGSHSVYTPNVDIAGVLTEDIEVLSTSNDDYVGTTSVISIY